MDDVNRGITEWESSLGVADGAACGTGNGDEHDERTNSAQRTRPRPAKVKLLKWSEWGRIKAYDERPPTCLHSSIMRKITLHNKLICKDTEQDLT
jgi:hypothetical protein